MYKRKDTITVQREHEIDIRNQSKNARRPSRCAGYRDHHPRHIHPPARHPPSSPPVTSCPPSSILHPTSYIHPPAYAFELPLPLPLPLAPLVSSARRGRATFAFAPVPRRSTSSRAIGPVRRGTTHDRFARGCCMCRPKTLIIVVAESCLCGVG